MYKLPSRANKLVVKSRTFQREFHQNVTKNDDNCSSPNDSNSKGSSVSSGSRTESPDNFSFNHDTKVKNHHHHHNHHSRSTNNTNRHFRRHRSDFAMISFVQTGWNQVMMEYQSSLKQESPSVTYYKPKMDDSPMKVLFSPMTKQNDKKKKIVKKQVSPKMKPPPAPDQMKWHKRSFQDENTSILHASLSRQSGRERNAAEQTAVPSYHPNVSAAVGVGALSANKTGDHISLVSRSHDQKTSSSTDSKSGGQKFKSKSGACICKSICCVLLIIIVISAVVGVVLFRKKIRQLVGIWHPNVTTSHGIPYSSSTSRSMGKISTNVSSFPDDYNDTSGHTVPGSTIKLLKTSPDSKSKSTNVTIIDTRPSTTTKKIPPAKAAIGKIGTSKSTTSKITTKKDTITTTVKLKIGQTSTRVGGKPLTSSKSRGTTTFKPFPVIGLTTAFGGLNRNLSLGVTKTSTRGVKNIAQNTTNRGNTKKH